MNYTETLNYIHSLGNFSMSSTLDRIKSVLLKLNNPQNKFKAIHIAGTNGKGSVSTMLANVFKMSGYKTALFISPYVIDFCERIQIDGEFISQEDLCHFAQIVKDTNIKLTEFEFITAVAFLYFADKGCQIAIIETGLGGRFDATNTMDNVIANVITKIGLDHTSILGDTIEKITAEKCGIIKNCPLIISHNQSAQAMSVLKNYSPIFADTSQLEIINCDVSGNTYIYEGKKFETSLVGEHQIENSLIVIETVKNCGIDVHENILKKAIAQTYFPARMEVISKQPLVILDGAHNLDGAKALSQVFKNYKKVTALIGMMRDKDWQSVLETTLPFCKKVIAVEVENMPRSLYSNEIQDFAKDFCECDVAKNYDDAISKLNGESTVFVFGSLYLASALREKLKKFYNKT